MRVALLAVLLSGCVVNSKISVSQGLGPTPSPTPQESKKIITLICDEKCTPEEKDRLKQIEHKLNETLGSECFEQYILAHKNTLKHLPDGAKASDLVKSMRTPQTMLVNYYSDMAIWVLGYEVGGEPVVHLNRLAVTWYGFSVCDQASVAAHEVSHAKGWMHLGNDPREHDNLNSAPYKINDAFDSGAMKGGCCK